MAWNSIKNIVKELKDGIIKNDDGIYDILDDYIKSHDIELYHNLDKKFLDEFETWDYSRRRDFIKASKLTNINEILACYQVYWYKNNILNFGTVQDFYKSLDLTKCAKWLTLSDSL